MLNKKITPDFSPRKPFTPPAPKNTIIQPPPPVQFPAYVPQKPIPYKNPPIPQPISQAFTVAHETPMVIENSVINFAANTTPLSIPPFSDATASFSPNLETFTSTGSPYFLTQQQSLNDVAQWATYPAISDVSMGGFDINAAGSITANSISSISILANNISSIGNALFQSTLTAQDLTVTSGAIKLTPSHVLETIGGDLFFDTELLAKANDIQQIADWSLYPALSTINMNGSNIINAQKIQTVQLTNASGTFGSAGQVLASDGTKIDWVTPATPGNVSQWATFPAVSSINMSTNNITNAQKIQTVQLTNASGTFGSAGQYLTSDGTTINWITAPAPSDVSQWATFPASANVSLPNRNLDITSTSPGISYPTASLNANVQIGNTSQAPLRPDFNAYCGSFNVGSITSPATSINLTSIGNVSVLGGGGVGITGGGGVSVAGVGGVAITGAGNLSLAGGDVQVTGLGVVSVGAGGVAITGGGGVAITGGGAVAVTGGVGVSVLGGGGVAVTGGGGVSVVGGAGVLINSGGSLKTETITNVSGTGNTLAINNVSTINGAVYPPPGGGGVTSLNTQTGVVSITSPTANLVVGSTGAGNIELTVPGGALSSFLSLYSIFVAPNGNDTTGTGSANNPYLTITRAVTARALIANTIEVAIQLFPGTYTPAGGGVSIPQNTFLVGIPSGEITQAVNIVAQVGLVAGTGTVGLYGLNLFPASSQCVIINGVGTYNITNCNIFNNGGNYAISQSLGTLYLTECRVTTPTTGSFPGIGLTGPTASIIIRDCLITSSGTPSLITCVGSMIMRQCNLINTSVLTTVNPLVNYNPTAAGTTCEISYTTLQYTSAVVASANGKICIRCNPTAGITAAMVNCVNNLLICEGSQSGGPQFHCIDKVVGSGPVTLSYGNLLAGATANRIDGNITKTQYVTVP